MKKSLLDVLFMSEKRKGVLLLLKDGTKETEYLLDCLDTTRQALLPQIRILQEHCLVSHFKDAYELTPIGKLIVDEMTLLLDKIEVLDTGIDYWTNHKMDFIPTHLLKRIDDLGKCKIINPHVTEMFEIDREFHEASKKSRAHFIITTYFHPKISDLADELINNNVELHFIISNDLFAKLYKEKYTEFAKFLQNNLVHFFVYPKKMDFQSVAYNDYYIILDLIKTNGELDVKRVLCNGNDSLKWGKDLFEYYLKDSIPISGF